MNAQMPTKTTTTRANMTSSILSQQKTAYIYIFRLIKLNDIKCALHKRFLNTKQQEPVFK